VVISPARLSVYAPLVESHYRWPVIERVERTPEAVLVYISAVSAVLLPLRAFRNEADVAATEQLLRERCL
jgi:hypothetical protein